MKFLQPHLLRSQKLSPSPEQSATLRPSDLGTPNTVASLGSITSRRSTASSVPSATVGSFHNEAETQEYDFENEEGG